MSELSDDNLESLLRHASPRPAPDKGVEADVRAAVHTEWQQVTEAIRRRRAARRFALAASVLLAAFVLFGVFRQPQVEQVNVATIQKSFGSIYILDSSSRMTPATRESVVRTGQVIATGEKESGLALSWHTGGSLRFDSNTEVEFVAEDLVRLRRGRLYFDSQISELMVNGVSDSGASLIVETDFGRVENLGTQYMVDIGPRLLGVSVREGQVTVSIGTASSTIASGKRGEFGDRGAPTILDVNGHGGDWRWITSTTPAIDAEGRSVDDLLRWATRELGYTLHYANPEIEQRASDGSLKGTIALAPDEAIRVWMPATGFAWRIDEGIIYVGIEE